MERSHKSNIAAVVVTYQPELDALEQLLNALIPQVTSVVIVDNGSHPNLFLWGNGCCIGNIKWILLGENRGIAAAQNIGIEWARNHEAKFVLLMDQDSLPEPTMVSKLLSAAEALRKQGHSVAAVGPRYTDEKENGRSPFIKLSGFRLTRQPCHQGDSVVEVDCLISSGSLIPCAAIEIVGGMKEELFIDYVDIEWGLRSKRMGYKSFGVCGASMAHSLGDAPIEVFGRQFACRSQLRHYYTFRNAIWLYRQKWLPLPWKIADCSLLLLKFFFYSLFAKPRYQHWWMMTKGIWHGVSGQMGRLD